jgi:DNA damage-binding protein 1
LPLDKQGMTDPFSISLEENRVIDIKFLYGCHRPTLCILYEDNRRARHLKTIAIDLREKIAQPGPWNRDNVEYFASIIIPVPSPIYGVLVIGMNTISYIGNSNTTMGNVQTVEIQASHVTSYCRIDELGTRYLWTNIKGQLHVVSLILDLHSKVINITTDFLGHTAIAETINYLDHGIVYIGSCVGDSQLIKLHAQPYSTTDGYIEMIDSYPNLGPIVDMVVLDEEKQGLCKQIVTCSGFSGNGSLRIVRSGIGIQEQASLEIPGIKGIWSLKISETAEYDKYLIQSFIGETRILAIEGEELGEVNYLLKLLSRSYHIISI